jgi:hypothetical protein
MAAKEEENTPIGGQIGYNLSKLAKQNLMKNSYHEQIHLNALIGAVLF